MITAVVALLWVLCVVIGLVSVVFLRDFLVSRLDIQLNSAMNVITGDRQHGGGPEQPPPNDGGPFDLAGAPSQCTDSAGFDSLPFPGLPAGSVAARMVGGQLVLGTGCWPPPTSWATWPYWESRTPLWTARWTRSGSSWAAWARQP